MPRQPNPATARRWQQCLDHFEQSNLSVLDFCDQEGISTASFYAWRRRLGHRPASAQPAPSDFLPVRLVSPSPAVELVLPSGLTLRIGPDCEPELLRQVLVLVGATAC